MVRTVLFDLDGTLLPLDTDEFVRYYFRYLARHLAAYVPPAEVAEKVMASTMAMIHNTDPNVTNLDAFWADFCPRVQQPREVLEPVTEQFYVEQFPKLGPEVLKGKEIIAPQVLNQVLDMGYEIVLATNPLFPRAAILARMEWAGILDYPWKLVTVLEEMHFTKPQPGYYREVLERIGRPPGECLMVGNDVQEDGVAARLGMGMYFATDYLIDRNGGPAPPPSGPLAAFPGWLAGTRP